MPSLMIHLIMSIDLATESLIFHLYFSEGVCRWNKNNKNYFLKIWGELMDEMSVNILFHLKTVKVDQKCVFHLAKFGGWVWAVTRDET